MGDMAWKWAFVFHIWKLKELEWKQMFLKTMCQNNSSNSQLSPELSKQFFAHSSLADGFPMVGGDFVKDWFIYLFIVSNLNDVDAKIFSVSLLTVLCFLGVFVEELLIFQKQS